MPEPYDLDKMLKEISADEGFAPKKAPDKASQDEIREMIRKKRQKESQINER